MNYQGYQYYNRFQVALEYMNARDKAIELQKHLAKDNPEAFAALLKYGNDILSIMDHSLSKQEAGNQNGKSVLNQR